MAVMTSRSIRQDVTSPEGHHRAATLEMHTEATRASTEMGGFDGTCGRLWLALPTLGHFLRPPPRHPSFALFRISVLRSLNNPPRALTHRSPRGQCNVGQSAFHSRISHSLSSTYYVPGGEWVRVSAVKSWQRGGGHKGQAGPHEMLAWPGFTDAPGAALPPSGQLRWPWLCWSLPSRRLAAAQKSSENSDSLAQEPL